MVVDNVEAEVGVVIEGDNGSLPALPLTKGVHFDQFGVGMGIFFKPPGFALGLQGKFHLQSMGLTAEQVKACFEPLGGEFAKFAAS